LWLIFLSSLVFYGFWRVEFLPVMLLSVITDYIVAWKIHQVTERKIKKRFLLISLFINLGLLFYFKYLLFFADNTIGLMNFVGIEADPLLLSIILPLGISFYTFQTISYTVDVYRGVIEPEKDFVIYGCYVTFFPQLVAGPILRAAEVIHQFTKRPPFNWANIAIGSRRILYGLFLKVVLADNIAPLVDSGFAQPVSALSAFDVWTLAFLFGFQIYFDFSAYSHIALGSARLMGISFPENFNFPYLASSPRDFWRRWHISLSSWIRDYLYLPLAGIRVHDSSIGGLATAASIQHSELKNWALVMTWAIMGLWHGANWTFIIWGLYHAAFILLYRLTVPWFSNLSHTIQRLGGWVITLVIVMLGWIPFRAQNITDTLAMYLKIFQPTEYLWLGLRENTYIIAALILMAIIFTYLTKTYLMPLLRQRVWLILIIESLVFSVIIGLIFVFLRPINQFIYFQF
jgi:D-alanyl-lipoteichoic acid acyltransferase DltB (MBOAT superfamily)